jgi:hypothetical protein
LAAGPPTEAPTAAAPTSTIAATSCAGIVNASPTPSGAICNVQADAVAVTGSGLLVAYTSGAPFVTSVQACAAECVATTFCTNFYFNNGANCNLHYGPISYVVNTNGVNAFSLYETSCFTGVAEVSPIPAAAICNVQADAVAVIGSGLLTSYTSESPFVASAQACAAECITTSTCTNIYFNTGVNCNLHYGPISYVANTNGVNAFSLYNASCFSTVTTASPIPLGAICDVQADAVAITGSGLLTAYTSGSPYVISPQACAAQCVATSTCTNFYFNAGVNCNLHYGATSYVLNTNGVNAYSLYDVSCFSSCAF